jgi:hypothetical protein
VSPFGIPTIVWFQSNSAGNPWNRLGIWVGNGSSTAGVAMVSGWSNLVCAVVGSVTTCSGDVMITGPSNLVLATTVSSTGTGVSMILGSVNLL